MFLVTESCLKYRTRAEAGWQSFALRLYIPQPAWEVGRNGSPFPIACHELPVSLPVPHYLSLIK